MDHRLFDRLPGTRKEYDHKVKTVCQECAVRCGLVAYLSQGKIVDLHGDDEHPVSRGRLCARGLAFIQGIDHPLRITSAGIRRTLQDPFDHQEDGEKALDFLADLLRKIKDQYGPESILIACDPHTDLDFALGAAKFAGLLGLPVIYSPSAYEKDCSEFPLSGIPFYPCPEWTQSRVLLLVEADPATTHPVAFGWALEARQRGGKLITADSRFTRTMAKADKALRIKPHTGNMLGLALMKMILERPGFDDDFIKTRFAEPERWQASFERLSWEELENVLGISRKSINEVGELLSGNRPITIITGERLADFPKYGIWSTLMKAMGWDEIKGSGWYPLTGMNPWGLVKDQDVPGVKSIADLVRLSKGGGLSAKALIYSGDGLVDLFDSAEDLTRDLDWTVCFGAYPNSARQKARTFFPSILWAEKSGLCFSTDRLLQWAEKILDPPAGCRSSLDFWSGLAKRFGWNETFPGIREDGSADPGPFYQSILKVDTLLKRMRLGELKDAKGRAGGYRPAVEGGPEEEKLNPTFAPEKLEFSSAGLDNGHYPLTFIKIPLVTRSTGMGTYWSWAEQIEAEEAVQIHPETAKRLQIGNGEAVMISSPDKTFEARAWLTRMVLPGMAASSLNLESDRVLIYKTDQMPDEALTFLKK
jgi:anaerobic selenocysteine-containing dehydrogenase